MKRTSVLPQQDRLNHERNEILIELSHLHEVIQAEVDLEPDEGDEQITEHETAAILISILEQRLLDIDHALTAIKLGEYARCERCGHEIDHERLAVKPDARYCRKCQEKVERIVQHAQPVPNFDVGF